MNENPYESPKYSLATDSSSSQFGDVVYYRTDSRRLTYAEFWRLARSPFEFLVAAILKTLRIRLPVTFAFSGAVSCRQVDSRQISESAALQLRPLADQAAECGLCYSFSYVLPSLGWVESIALAYCSQDGSTVVPIVYVKMWNVRGTNEQVAYSCLSRLNDGRVIATSGSKFQLNGPPEYSVEHLPGQPLRDVFARHQARLAEHTSPMVCPHTPAEVLNAIRGYEHRSMEFQQSRGVYVAVTPLEMEALARLSTQMAPTGPAKSTAFQGLEFICLIALVACLFFAAREMPGNLAQWSILAIGGAGSIGGLILIWVYRAFENRRKRIATRRAA